MLVIPEHHQGEAEVASKQQALELKYWKERSYQLSRLFEDMATQIERDGKVVVCFPRQGAMTLCLPQEEPKE